MEEHNARPERQNIRSIRVPAMIYPYSSGLAGGLLGGLAMIPVAVAYGLLSGTGIWYPVNLIAATVFRSWQQASPEQLAQFSLAGLLVGLLIHLAMSLTLGFIFAVMLPALPRNPIFWALVVGPVLWAGAIFDWLPLFNPVMARNVDLLSFGIANITYSLVLGWWVIRTPKVPAES
ncbi:MAG: hypothetical protein EHM21_12365 [Chloroflexi bacterium]|nr:MAG: hypothetical protein EHM21_12365 [Chloroflexota bacterium]